MVGSGLFWPDLGISRIVNITPSSGDRPERQDSSTADIFRITLDPGAVITFVAELRTDRLPQLYLWEPDAYKDKVNSFTLYHGIVIGIAGLLALFLTILFVVKGSVMFPAAAALGWAVLAYIGIDFGFWGKVFELSSRRRARSGAQPAKRSSRPRCSCSCSPISISIAGTCAMPISPSRWLALLGALVALALFDPAIAAGIARISLVPGRGRSALRSSSISRTHGFDRAVLLIPTWLLLLDLGRSPRVSPSPAR